MKPVTDERELDEIVALVERYLGKHQPGEYHLDVRRESVHQDDGVYYVVVEPNREGVSLVDWTARMVEAELDLQEAEDRNILLVPVIPPGD